MGLYSQRIELQLGLLHGVCTGLLRKLRPVSKGKVKVGDKKTDEAAEIVSHNISILNRKKKFSLLSL